MSASVLLALVVLLPACSFLSTDPLPQAEWRVPSHPLYRAAVGIETDGGHLGGGVIVRSEPGATYVLTNHHVIDGEDGIRVGVFRHSQVDAPVGAPEYQRFEADVEAGSFLVDERLLAAFEECAAALSEWMGASGGAAKLPSLEPVVRSYQDLVQGIDAARERKDVRAAISRFLESMPRVDRNQLRRELAAAGSDVAIDPALAERISRALQASVEATRRIFHPSHPVVGDVTLLRIRTEGRLHAAACLARPTEATRGATAHLVTIYPGREPSVRKLELAGAWGTDRLRLARGRFEAGNSGSPVFVDGRLAGIVVAGMYSTGETPGDTFDEGAFVRVDAIRAWLARRDLSGILTAPPATGRRP